LNRLQLGFPIFIFGIVTREIGPHLTEESWHIMLEVLLKVASDILPVCLLCFLNDFLLFLMISRHFYSQSTSHKCTLGNALCSHLVRVLFDLWLQAPLRFSHPLWSRLATASRQWLHRPW
jgi:hypothetical protein